MIYNKKGLSEVVTTVIFVSLALIAIGIVWAVINGLVQRGASDVATTEKCLKINIDPTSASCVAGSTLTPPVPGFVCSVTLNRKAGGDAIEGVKLVFKDAEGISGTTVAQYIGDIEPLTSQIADTLNTDLTTTPKTVEISPFLKDEQGNEVVCSQVKSFTIASA